MEKQSTKHARPTNLPPAWISAEWIWPRLLVELPRISHVLHPAKIKSSPFFSTARALFAERLTPLRWPALFFIPPFLTLPPKTFRLEFEIFAFFWKHAAQNFARVDLASFGHRRVEHFFCDFVRCSAVLLALFWSGIDKQTYARLARV